ncbi:TonB-dependent receptor [Lacinutrix salivirga]
MKIKFFMLLFIVTVISHSQNTINGTVTDATNNSPLEFVTVYFPTLEKGTITDVNGNFSVSDIPSGNYRIIFSIVGYQTGSQKLSIPNLEAINVSLNPSAIEMEEIIISTPFHQLQSENVMKVEQEKISNLQAKGAVSLADGITEIAGVESVTTGLGIGKPVIRGLSSNRVLVYAQGVRLENQQFGDEHGLGVSESGIESVEVIKGPASLLYGSDALGGVLYLNPERFANSNSKTADFSTRYFSNTKGYNANLGYKASSDKFKFLIRGSQTEHSDYDTKSYRVTNTRFKEKDFKAGIGYQSSKFKSEFRYNVNLSNLGIPEGIEMQSTARTPLEPYQKLQNHILSSKSKWFFKNSSLDVNLGYIYNDRKEFEDHHHGEEDEHDEHSEEESHEDEAHEEEHDDEHEEDEAAALHMSLSTFNYDIKYHLPTLGKFETIVGVQGMHQTNANFGEEQLIPNATTNDVGVLATSHIHFETFDVQLGARFDSRTISILNTNNKHYNSFNGAAGVKTNIAKNVVARLNLASGFRAPNLAELASNGTHEGTNRYETGNLDLNNEQNFQTDLALEYKNEHVELFVNGFYNVVNNYIYLSPNGDIIDNTPVFNYLQEDAKLYGGEIGFHLHPHPLDWLHLESSFETVTGKQNNGDYLPLIPANNLNNTLRVEFTRPWLQSGYAFVKLQSTFKQENTGVFETTTDGYNLLSLGFGGEFKLFDNNLSFNIVGTNLTNQEYVNHLSRLKSENIFNIGRNISVGLKYTL